MDRRCEQCPAAMPLLARAHARYCSARCRQRASRARRALPAEMTSARRWVRRTATKAPLRSDGRPASSTDPATWSTHSTAARSRQGAGLGFVLAQGDGLVCIDLDHCLTGGRLADWAREILDRCPPTFIEISASGGGLHIFGRGTLAHGRRIRRDGESVEVYGQGRYIAVTGDRFENAPATLADLSEVITSLT